MNALNAVGDGLSSFLSSAAWRAIVEFCEQTSASPPFRILCLVLLVLGTIWAIAKVYGGDLQNVRKGPIAIRSHGAGWPSQKLYIHRDLVPLQHDGLKATCSFYYVYDDADGRPQKVLLERCELTLGVEANRLQRKKGTVFGTEVPSGTQTLDVCFPTLDTADEPAPVVVQATPVLAADYLTQNRVLERWAGDDGLSLVSVDPELLDLIHVNRENFIRDRANKAKAAREKRENAEGLRKWLLDLFPDPAPKRRPSVVGNYYLQFHFSNDPIFVLRRHPDRDVRMTAWLTVLTSLFALAMELFPPVAPATTPAPQIAQATNEKKPASSGPTFHSEAISDPDAHLAPLGVPLQHRDEKPVGLRP